MSKAKGEPSSVDPVDKDDQVVLAQTNFSTYFLETPASRLYVAMHKQRSKHDIWRGHVQCREFGFDERAGVSPAVPVGATGSRSRDLSILLSLLNSKTATVSLTDGVSDCGIPSKVLQIKRAPPVDYTVSVYFDPEHSMVIQHKQSRGGVLQSNSVVVETMTVADGDQEFVLPEVIVTSSRTPIPGPIQIQFPGPINLQRRDQWTLHRSIVTLAKFQSVPLEEMVIDLQGAEPRFSRQGMLDGKRKRYPSNQLTGVERITAQNLDELVSGLFANVKEKTE
ncbi:hypothetical protein AB1L42_20680 [Thalassoglobus sp. JC818]|uniref:hypothetical protein n=1 Tax=Thalassoglobus sp. JC818 TaxID=3232136 RepID=UPI00345B0D2F